jgi:hypothetical protein
LESIIPEAGNEERLDFKEGSLDALFEVLRKGILAVFFGGGEIEKFLSIRLRWDAPGNIPRP